jgi:hypothetical protein
LTEVFLKKNPGVFFLLYDSRTKAAPFPPERVFMKHQACLAASFIFAGTLFAASGSRAAYESPSVSDTNLPYTVQTKTLLKHWFNNRTVIGGQIIALNNGKGSAFSGNYLDVGELGGVKKGDVFAVYTRIGDPVGFLKIVQPQHYTSSFEFLELTVAPSENLIAKKVSDELRKRIPESIKYVPGTHAHKGEVVVAANKTPASASTQTLTVPGGSVNLPPLPGAEASPAPALPAAAPPSTEPSAAPALPALPSSSPAPAAETAPGLPPLPGGSDAGGMPPLPSDNGAGGLPPLPGDSGSQPPAAAAPPPGDLPPLPGDGSGAPPPTDLPPLP